MVDYLQVSFKKNLFRILPRYTLLPILYQVYLKSGTYLNFKIFEKWFGHDQFKNPWQKFTLVIIISQNLSIHENAFRLNMLKIRVEIRNILYYIFSLLSHHFGNKIMNFRKNYSFNGRKTDLSIDMKL